MTLKALFLFTEIMVLCFQGCGVLFGKVAHPLSSVNEVSLISVPIVKMCKDKSGHIWPRLETNKGQIH